MRAENIKMLKNSELLASKIVGGAEGSYAKALISEIRKAVIQEERYYSLRYKYPVTYKNASAKLLKSIERLESLYESQKMEVREMETAYRKYRTVNRMMTKEGYETCAYHKL